MPNASIYSMIQPVAPQMDPLARYAQVAQLQAMGDASDLNALQRKKLVTDMDEEARWKAALGKLTDFTKPLPAEAVAAAPMRAMQFEKLRLEGDKARADLQKTNLEIAGKRLSQTRDIIAGIGSDADMAFAKEQMMRLHGPEVVAQMPFFQQPFDRERQRQAVMTAEQLVTALTPKIEKVQIDNGGVITTEMVDINPFTNPGVRNMKIVTQKVESPDAKLADKRAREEGDKNRGVTIRGQNMTDDRARDAAERADWTYDAERGLMVNKRTAATRPVTQADGVTPIDPKLSETQKKELAGIDAQVGTIRGALQAVEKTPSAFSLPRGAATMAGPMAETVAGRFDSDDERQARSYVFNVVSKAINERAGAAQSAQELARLRSFLPAEADNAEQIKSKLNGYLAYLGEQRAAWAKPQSATPPEVPKPKAPEGADSLAKLDPAKYMGKIARNPETGERYKSDGSKWVRVTSN